MRTSCRRRHVSEEKLRDSACRMRTRPKNATSTPWLSVSNAFSASGGGVG